MKKKRKSSGRQREDTIDVAVIRVRAHPSTPLRAREPHPRFSEFLRTLRHDEWQTQILPALKKVPLPRLVRMSRKSRRMLINTRVGRTRPYRKNQALLASIVRKFGII